MSNDLPSLARVWQPTFSILKRGKEVNKALLMARCLATLLMSRRLDLLTALLMSVLMVRRLMMIAACGPDDAHIQDIHLQPLPARAC